jgi:TonB family protein
MPRTLKLLLAAALAVPCGASARAQSGVRRPQPQQPPPPAAAEQVEVKPLPQADAAALEAEQVCANGRDLAASGQAPAAREALGRGLKIYLDIYLKERPAEYGRPAPADFRQAMRARLKGAPQCVDDYLRVGGAVSPFERSQLEAFRGQALMFAEAEEALAALLGAEVDRRAVITRKPEPGFPEEARRANVRGVVRLRAVLAADGSVRHVFVLKGLPHGLSEECVAAARRMTFKPAVKNGQPVSQFVLLEYNFNTY